jgi:protein-S-isoprenylcysteine O-methyltransferase
MPVLPAFLALLITFHCSEFILACVYQRKELAFSSTLLSRGYVAAMAAAVLEHAVEQHLMPQFKASLGATVISAAGLVLALSGEAMRKAAILTAQHSFTHAVAFEKRRQHQLVTSGVYGWVRHPGYLGFALWAVGTQLLLVNPLCCCLFVAVVWVFFSRRIPVEEQQLVRFFGEAYTAYQQRVPCGMPFIS